MISVSTIGFTQTSAKDFFHRLKKSGVRKVIDVRLNNTSQLSAFAKSEDLKYFLRDLANIDYVHLPILAPTDDMLRAYKTEKGRWEEYEPKFLSLMSSRHIESRLTPEMLDGTCLLCSEATPHQCHRRLVLEYLSQKWPETINVQHL